MLGLMTRSAAHDATRRGRARMAEIDRELASAAGPDPALGELLAAADPYKVWEALPLENQRMIVGRFVVKILPTGRAGRGFNPESVSVEPRRS